MMALFSEANFGFRHFLLPHMEGHQLQRFSISQLQCHGVLNSGSHNNFSLGPYDIAIIVIHRKNKIFNFCELYIIVTL